MKHFTTARYGLSIHTTRPSRLRRLGFAAAWVAVLAAAVLLLLAGAARAAEPGYDPRAAMERDALVSAYVRASWCMQDAAKAILRQGGQRRLAVEFADRTCGSGMRAFLGGAAGWSRRDSDILLRAMAERAVARELGEGAL